MAWRILLAREARLQVLIFDMLIFDTGGLPRAFLRISCFSWLSAIEERSAMRLAVLKNSAFDEMRGSS
ncbi:MAG: hypothetical protein WCQ16_08095 [Verrucomicrobiae bacterium]